MSRAIKLHTPAGRVRMMNPSAPARGTMPLPALDDMDVTDEAWTAEEASHARQRAGHDGSSSSQDIEERLREEFKAGFDEGRRHAERMTREETRLKEDEMRMMVMTLLESISRQYEEFRFAAERNVVRLATAIAERVIKNAITIDNEFVIRQIHDAMKRVVGVERIRIRVNPLDEEFVRAHRTDLLTSADAVRELTLEADETIARGSCVLESDAGNVDASVATQLERIEVALFADQESRQ